MFAIIDPNLYYFNEAGDIMNINSKTNETERRTSVPIEDDSDVDSPPFSHYRTYADNNDVSPPPNFSGPLKGSPREVSESAFQSAVDVSSLPQKPEYHPQEEEQYQHQREHQEKSQLVQRQSFLYDLFSIISDPTQWGYDESNDGKWPVTWLEHGRGFIFNDKPTFEKSLLPKFLPSSKFSSFTRRLTRWKFVRVSSGAEMGAYYHPYFVRNRPENIRLINTRDAPTINPEFDSSFPASALSPGLHINDVYAGINRSSDTFTDVRDFPKIMREISRAKRMEIVAAAAAAVPKRHFSYEDEHGRGQDDSSYYRIDTGDAGGVGIPVLDHQMSVQAMYEVLTNQSTSDVNQGINQVLCQSMNHQRAALASSGASHWSYNKLPDVPQSPASTSPQVENNTSLSEFNSSHDNFSNDNQSQYNPRISPSRSPKSFLYSQYYM
ncbi:predicted protein [Thalassiosira pseudonana CCMP1335]|jgi:hypothetical protein|uniref:HSF-type DNA-binding domain-containing protein n=1 Tax=Thalassiosira pseudonana TaxID=35128 RepID=B8CGL0_THAPS|nr:predicted protein [Thalassiosira pseudonana CCMP1335]EED87382.1 predicted protein [Thalassiosira pseudonana CCMP1335]